MAVKSVKKVKNMELLAMSNELWGKVPEKTDAGKGEANIQLLQEQIHYRKTSNISRTLVVDKIVDNSDVVGASPVGAAPTTSSFST